MINERARIIARFFLCPKNVKVRGILVDEDKL